MFLVAEYCRGPFYMGWHLYLRENRTFRQNKYGWGWIRRIHEHPVESFLSSLGITIRGDGTCDDDGIAEFAMKYPIKGRRCGGRLRGCLKIEIDNSGEIEMANQSLDSDRESTGGSA